MKEFKVMLGTPIEKCKLKEGEWFSISQKLNGNRCVYVGGKLMTRQGNEFTGLGHILADLKKLPEGMVYDGELLCKNTEGLSDTENFQKSSGIANSKYGDKRSLQLVIFDMLPAAEFERGTSEKTYKERRAQLCRLKEKSQSWDLKT